MYFWYYKINYAWRGETSDTIQHNASQLKLKIGQKRFDRTNLELKVVSLSSKKIKEVDCFQDGMETKDMWYFVVNIVSLPLLTDAKDLPYYLIYKYIIYFQMSAQFCDALKNFEQKENVINEWKYKWQKKMSNTENWSEKFLDKINLCL